MTKFRDYSQRYLTIESGFDPHFSESDRRGILWIIERITSVKSPRLVDVWVKLLRRTLSWHNLRWKKTKYIDAILEARKISSAMRSEFEIEIELDSEKAQQAKASYSNRQSG